MRVATALLLTALFSCAPGQRLADATSPQALATCAARGGITVLEYRAPGPSCLTPFSDAGRYCSDSTQCEGRCLAGEPPVTGPGRTVSGQCEFYHSNGFGESCGLEVRGGRVAPGCSFPKDES